MVGVTLYGLCMHVEVEKPGSLTSDPMGCGMPWFRISLLSLAAKSCQPCHDELRALELLSPNFLHLKSFLSSGLSQQ